MRIAVLAVLALVAASPAAAAPPRAGVLVPGRSLGGLELGATQAEVRSAWGPRFGFCRGCAQPTWYFNFQQFEPQGAGVSFRAGRATAIFTVWAPRGWRTRGGLRIGDAVTLGSGFTRTSCGTYFAFTTRAPTATTTIYSRGGKVWGFGLSRPSIPVCR